MRGHVSSSTDTSNATAAERAALIHREILQLGVLIAIGIAGFLLTRAVAASNRAMNISDAAEWYQRGAHALQAGQVDDAIDAFRRARVRNRTNSPVRARISSGPGASPGGRPSVGGAHGAA